MRGTSKDSRSSSSNEENGSSSKNFSTILQDLANASQSASKQQTESEKALKHLFQNNKDDHFLIPLGGAEEIGMNCNLYVHNNKMLMIDLGVHLTNIGNGSAAVLPDLEFVKKNKSKRAAHCCLFANARPRPTKPNN